MSTVRTSRASLLVAISAVLSAACASAVPTAPPTATNTAISTPTTAPAAGSPVAATVPSTIGPEPTTDPWRLTAGGNRAAIGEAFDYDCPPNGSPYTIWGTDVYTDDSSVCTAAVHAGLIAFAQGGRVTIVIRPGEDAYVGSERNGVESSDYGAWGGSYVFVTR